MNFDDLKLDDLSTIDSLEHHGRKGMRWYQHIFGKEQAHAKYSKGSSSDNKNPQRNRQQEAAKKKAAKEKVAAEKRAIKERKEAEKKAAKEKKDAEKKQQERLEILSNPRKLYKHRKEFSYDEIQKAMQTFEWEKKLSGFSKEQLKRGSDYINSLVTYANGAINLYNLAARVVNSVASDGETNILPHIGGGEASKNKATKKKKKPST